MSVSVERLRRWLLAGAGLLLAIIVGFLAYAHYRAHRFLTELPKKLGADIRQETNAFTWSQTVKGKTVFTLHAAKAIQHKDGKYTLHDVGIAVYGHGAERGDRVDRIYGKEFDLDQGAGVVRATGEVHLDLEAPMAADAAGKMDYAAGKDLKATGESGAHEVGKGDARLIHVKTSGLVYLQKLGVAATDEDIEFEYNGLTGHAKGAEYDADTGVLVLQSSVKMNGLQKGRPVLLTASRAEMDRATHTITLSQAKYVTVSEEGGSHEARQTVEARKAMVLMRNDGSAERLKGDGGVMLTQGDGSRMTADRGEVLLSAENKPQSMQMTGKVRYVADDSKRQANGEAEEIRASFDKTGHAEKAVLIGGVHLHERMNSTGSERELNAGTVELKLSAEGGKPRPRDVNASGDARLKVTDAGKAGKGSRMSAMSADLLTAHFIAGSGGQHLDAVKGTGRTTLEQLSETGTVDTSSADSLEARFRSAAGVGKKGSTAVAGIEGHEELASAVQEGHVVMSRKAAAKPGDSGPPQVDHATAAKVAYDGDKQRVTLSGGVEMSNVGGTMRANTVSMDQKTGDALAEGAVKAGYRQNAKGEVTHVLAGRAELKKATETAVFYGEAGGSARLWQGGSQVEAPMLEFAQKQRKLVARGEHGEARAVHTLFVGSAAASVGGKTERGKIEDSSTGGTLHKASAMRVESREMVYSDAERTAKFTGGVKVESRDGVMRGQEATVLLEQASQSGKKSASEGFLGGSVERIVVSGGIEIEQPNRRATGERLVYTAGDGVFALTGTAATPPRVVDQARGTVTGAELRFRTQDESVVISNGDTSSSGQRVHTETRVKRDR